jgi:hypothetical protein
MSKRTDITVRLIILPADDDEPTPAYVALWQRILAPLPDDAPPHSCVVRDTTEEEPQGSEAAKCDA